MCILNRGYLFFSVKDQNLFHRVDTISNIFMTGTATSENITNGVHECFPQSFQKSCFPGASKSVIVWELVNKEHFLGKELWGVFITFSYSSCRIGLWPRRKLFWQKEKKLVTSIFSFSQNVLKKPLFFTVVLSRELYGSGSGYTV